MAAVSGERFVTVHCPSCGSARETTERNSKRAARCSTCRRLDSVVVTDEECCWWLDSLDDETLAEILTHARGRECTASAVAELREMFGARPARVLSSVSERAGLVAA